MPLDSLKGSEFERVYVIGLHAEVVPGPVPTGPPDVPMKLGGARPATRTPSGGCSTRR